MSFSIEPGSGITVSGIKFNRDSEMLKWLSQFLKAIGKLDWFAQQDNKFKSIESLIVFMNHKKPFSYIVCRFCIAGKKIPKHDGEISFTLFLPKFLKEGVPVERNDTPMTNLIIFNKKDHLL